MSEPGSQPHPPHPPTAHHSEGRVVDGRLVAVALATLALVVLFGVLVLHSD